MRNNVGERGAWIGTWDYDVVASTETWMEPGQQWLLEVSGLRCFNKIREVGKRGGGVALLIKDSITSAERSLRRI